MSLRWCAAWSTAILLFGLSIASAPAAAQSNPNNVTPSNETGTKPYETYGGVRENINLATGNLSLTIPLLAIPGRNGHNLLLTASYDSKMWVVKSMYISATGDTIYWWTSETPRMSRL